MRAWLNQHVQALASALHRLWKNPVASFVSVLVIGLTLSLPAGLAQMVDNVRQLGGQLSPEPRLTLFLSLDSTAAEVEALEERLKSHPEVASYRYISRDQALQELKTHSSLSEVLAALERNPLPDAFVVVASDAAPDTTEALMKDMERWPRVDEVQLDSAWARKLAAFASFASSAAAALGILLAVALASVIAGTIDLQILARREEIEVSKLIGATDGFIRRPFLYHGVLQGLFGAGVALALVGLAIGFLNRSSAMLLNLYSLEFRLHGPALPRVLVLLAIAGALGWLGAFVSVNRHLKRIRPD
jgi:cell division transport system permease protein